MNNTNNIAGLPTWFIRLTDVQTNMRIAIYCLAIITNTFTLVTMAIARGLQTVSNMALASLAVADAMTGCLQLIFGAIPSDLEDKLPRYLLHVGLPMFPIYAAQLHTLIIAVERYIAVMHPLRYSAIWTPTRVACIIAGIWAVCALLTCSILIWGTIWDEPSHGNMLGVRALLTPMSVYVVLVTTVAVLYGSILLVARKQRLQIQAVHLEMNNITIKTHLKGTRMLTTVIAGVILCWGPLFLSAVIIDFITTDLWSYALQGTATCLGFSSSVVNIFIYAWRSKDFRKAYRLMLTCSINDLREM